MRQRALGLAFALYFGVLIAGCSGHGSTVLPQQQTDSNGSPRSTMATVTVSGPIVAVISSTKFEIQGGSGCGYVYIFTTSSTVFVPSGSRPAVGLNAQVTGSGSCATSFTATQVTLSSSPSTSVPKHVMTGAYLYSADGTTSHGRAFSAYASSLTWAETYSGTAVAATGIKTMFYTNPNRTEPGEALYTSDETTFAHTCSGARITQTGTTAKIYLMNPMSTHLVGLYKTFVNNELAKQHFDAIFDDEPFDWLALSAMPCNYTASTWLNAYINEMKALGHPVFYNGLGVTGPNNSISPSIQLNSGAIGGMGEACYTAHWNPHYASGSYWVALENTEIAMAQQNKIYICYANDLTTASSAIASRLFNYASFLLTYNVNTTMLWEYYGTTSGYTVLPESKLVALSPAVATPSNVSALRSSTGAYGRKYNACYIGGSAVGPCAVAVNSDSAASHAFPFTGYHHTLLLSGGGILDGGTISAAGGAPPSSMAPLTGVIAFQ
jgi:hypothetical protein